MSEPVQQQVQELEQVSYARLMKISVITPVVHSLMSMSGTISYGVADIFPPDYERDLKIWMILRTHSNQLDELVKTNIITDEEKKETLKQHEILLKRYAEVSHNVGKTVVACGNELFVGENLDDAVKKAREKYGKRPYYAETINLIAFSALFPPNADKF